MSPFSKGATNGPKCHMEFGPMLVVGGEESELGLYAKPEGDLWI